MPHPFLQTYDAWLQCLVAEAPHLSGPAICGLNRVIHCVTHLSLPLSHPSPLPPPPAQADFVRLQVEPEAAAAIREAVALYGAAGQELVAAADLDGFALGHPVKEIVARLVLAAE